MKFIKSLKNINIPDEMEILKYFKVIHLDDDFSVFVFYEKWFRWYSDSKADITWKHLVDLAEKAKLSWIFLRIDEDYTDVEEDSNFTGVGTRRYRLGELFEIEHSVKISNPILENYFNKENAF